MDEEMTERKDEIEKAINLLEWDDRLGQINPAKRAQLKLYKDELININEKLNGKKV